MDVIRLDPSEKGVAAQVYARSFFDYPMITYYWPDPERRARYLEWYWGCAIEYGLRYGQVDATPDVAGAVLWLPPGRTDVTTWRYIRAGFLPLPVRMGIRQFLTRTMKSDDLVHQVHQVHQEIMPERHWYLWAIAVDPDRQGQGIGTLLVRPGLARADAERLPSYGETHDERNMAFYTKLGFELVRTVQVPDSDLRFWCFVREPGGSPGARS
jgi:ribosomal protein S18 acetylase RimI-like enzyme